MSDDKSGQMDMFGGAESEKKEKKRDTSELKALSRVARRAIKQALILS